jgi:PAS domain S-box-containing protein
MVPVSLLMLVYIINEREDDIAGIRNEGLKISELCVSNVSSIVEGSRQLLMSLAYSSPLQIDDAAHENRLFHDLVQKTPYYLMIGMCNKDGLIISSSQNNDRKIYVNDREWFRRMQKSRDFAVGDYQIGRITGKPGITLGFPINGQPEDKVLSSVYATLDLDVIKLIFSRIILPEDCLVNLVDRNGTIIVSNPDNKSMLGKQSKGLKEFRLAGKKQGEYLDMIGSDGRRRLFNFQSVPGSDDGLYVGIGLSLDRIYADTRKDMITGFIWLGFTTAAAFVFVWFITGFSIIRHFRELVHATKLLAGGKTDARVRLKGGSREIRELAVSFDEMAGSLERYGKNLEQLVTERTAELEKAHKKLFESEELFRISFENANVGISLIKPDGNFIMANQAFCNMLGYTREELQGMYLTDIEHPDDLDTNRRDFSRIVSGDTPVLTMEKRYIRKDGQSGWAEISTALLRDKEKNPLYLIAHILDITERKLSEYALFASEERFRIAARSASDLIWEWDIQDGSLKWFGAIDSFLGYEHGEFPGTIEAWEESIHPDDRDRVMKSLNRHIEKNTTYNEEYRIRRKDGTYSIWTDRGDSVRNAGGIPVKMIGVCTDITKRRHDEDALRKSEENYRTIFDTANDAIFIHDLKDGRILDVNKRMCEMYSYTRDEALNLDIEAVSEGQPPYSQKDAAEKIRKAGLEGPQLFEWKAKDRLGNIFWVEVNLKLSSIGGKEVLMAIVRDITKRKKSEEERLNLEKQLHQSQKLESLGVLAGGIAHDFNNILMAILGNSELGLMNIPDGSPLRPRFEAINKASLRASEICKQMLAYSGKGRFMIQTLDLADVIREMMPILEVSVSRNVLLDYNLAEGLPLIEADRSQIQQIIMNLVINAAEAIGEKSGVINISAGFTEIDREYLDESHLENDLKEGSYVYLEIADTGCGIDSTTLSRIFDPFFSTKFTGRGLGLPAVHGIIRGHKGGIRIISEPGKGTIFRVLLPAVTYQVEQAPAVKKKEEAFTGSGTVLLVDDEESIRSLGRVMLERMGFSVYSAADGREAVDIFRKNSSRIICVLLDLTMPNMGGEETFRELRIIRPDIPVIICSGYNEDDVKSRFTGMNLSGFIQKPYQMNALIEVLKRVING